MRRCTKTRGQLEAEVDAALIALIALGLVEKVEGGYRAAYADDGDRQKREQGQNRRLPIE